MGSKNAAIAAPKPDDPLAALVSLDDECLDKKKVLQQVTSLQAETLEWKNKHNDMAQSLTIVQKDAASLAQVKAELVQQIARIQTMASKNVSDARLLAQETQEALDQQKEAYVQLERKYQLDLSLKDELADTRVQETENLWQKESELIQAKAKMEIQAAQLGSEQMCTERIHEQLDATTHKLDADDSPEDALQFLRVERVKYKVLQDENKALQEQLEAMKPLAARLQRTYNQKLAEHKEQLERQNVDTIEELVAEELQIRAEAINKESERQLAKAMHVCQEEMDLKIEGIEQSNTEHVKQLTKEYTDQISELEKSKTEMEGAIKELTQEKERLNRSLGDSTQDIANMQEKHERDIAAMQRLHEAEMEELEQKTEKRIEQSQKEALDELKNTFTLKEKEAEKAKSSVEKELKDTQRKLETQEKAIHKEQERIVQLKEQIQAKDAEVTFWHDQFHNRSYLNATHIQHDVIYWANAVQQKTGETFATAHDYYQVHVGQPTAKALKPVIQPCRKVYRDHLQKHLVPIFEIAQEQKTNVFNVAARAQSDFMGYLDRVFQSFIKDMKKSCPKWKKQVKDQPSFIRKNVDSLCQNPEGYINQTLTTTVLILLIVFHRAVLIFLIKCLVGTVVLTWKCVWFVCPLRFLPIWGRKKVDDKKSTPIKPKAQ